MTICVTLTKNYKVTKLFLTNVSNIFVGSSYVKICFYDDSFVFYGADNCKVSFPSLAD